MAAQDERLYIALLRALPQLGPRRVANLVAHFGSAARAWRQFGDGWRAVHGIQADDIARWRPLYRQQNPAALGAALHRHGLVLIALGDQAYPEGLLDLPNPPPVLYTAGDAAAWARPAVTIIGTRRCTPYGQQLATRLALDLARAGVTIVSGLAYGIDAAAHRGALSGGGDTAAVLATGLDCIYPAHHRDLAAQIRRRGVLISEYGPGTRVDVGRLRARNRLMAVLASVIVVVEADLKSGTMITVGHGLDCGRTIAAVPGPVGASASRGSNNLIREGAHLVRDAGDVLDLLSPAAGPRSVPSPPTAGTAAALTADERLLYAFLDARPVGYDELTVRSGLGAGQVSAALLRLELRGLIRWAGSGIFVRAGSDGTESGRR